MNDRIPFELRVLSGLHRGATLPVDEQPQLIGASDDADVVLVDPGVAPRHAMLRLEAGGWSLLGVDGAVRGAQHDGAEDQHALAPGAAARVGHVWLTVSAGDAPWQEPPADPPAGSAPPVEEEESLAEPEEPALEDAAFEPDAPPPAPPPDKPAAPRRRSRILLLPAALGATLLAVGAYAFTASPGGPPALAAQAVPKPVPAVAQRPTPAALREAFRARLAEVDLLRRFDMTLNDRAWTLRAALDDEETARFKRILAAFVAAHGIDFPIDVQLGGPDALLPFRVTQVISGANASIVTDDGQRLYPGDDHRGVKLVAIDGNKLRFNGARTIEVKW